VGDISSERLGDISGIRSRRKGPWGGLAKALGISIMVRALSQRQP
jgi:hypothetical protein